jgi:hypothetical protein
MGELGRRTYLDLRPEKSESQAEFRARTITRNLPNSLYEALKERMETSKPSWGHVVGMAMDAFLGPTDKD